MSKPQPKPGRLTYCGQAVPARSWGVVAPEDKTGRLVIWSYFLFLNCNPVTGRGNLPSGNITSLSVVKRGEIYEKGKRAITAKT
jgi:hypothetical protein